MTSCHYKSRTWIDSWMLKKNQRIHLVPMCESLDFFGQVLQYLLHLDDELEKQMEGVRDIMN